MTFDGWFDLVWEFESLPTHAIWQLFQFVLPNLFPFFLNVCLDVDLPFAPIFFSSTTSDLFEGRKEGFQGLGLKGVAVYSNTAFPCSDQPRLSPPFHHLPSAEATPRPQGQS